METMNVQELIDLLMQCDDKTLPVFGYDSNGDLIPITFVDDTLGDRVDLNLATEGE